MSNYQNRTFIINEKVLAGVLLFIFSSALIGVLSPSPCLAGSDAALITGDAPALSITPAVVEYKQKVKVLIAGSGFKPNTEIGLRIFMGKEISDIGFLIKPPAVTNDFGAFAGVWRLKREVRKKLLKPLVYSVVAVDDQGRQLASAPLVFCDPKAEKKSKVCDLMK